MRVNSKVLKVLLTFFYSALMKNVVHNYYENLNENIVYYDYYDYYYDYYDYYDYCDDYRKERFSQMIIEKKDFHGGYK